MTRREAKQHAWLKASSWLEALINAGYPYPVGDDPDPKSPAEARDLDMLYDAMREIIGFCERNGRRAP